jgi:hypothetical protein
LHHLDPPVACCRPASGKDRERGRRPAPSSPRSRPRR